MSICMRMHIDIELHIHTYIHTYIQMNNEPNEIVLYVSNGSVGWPLWAIKCISVRLNLSGCRDAFVCVYTWVRACACCMCIQACKSKLNTCADKHSCVCKYPKVWVLSSTPRHGLPPAPFYIYIWTSWMYVWNTRPNQICLGIFNKPKLYMYE